MELKKKVFEGVKWFSLGQLVSNVLSLIRMPIIAYFIVPSEYGVMSIIYMLITFGTIFSDSGIGKAWIQKQTNSLVVFSTVFWLNIFVCLIIYSFFFLSRNLVSSLFNDIQLVTLIPYASLGIVFSSIGQQYSFFLDKELKFKEKAIINLTTSIIGFLLLITLLILGYKLWAIIITNLAISLLKSFLFFIVGYRLFAVKFIFQFSSIKQLIEFGLYQLAQRFTNFLYTNIDYILIGVLMNTSVLGLYYMAYSIVLKPISILNPIINKVTFPIFTKIQDQTAKLKTAFLDLNSLLSFIIIPFYIALIFIAPIIFNLFFSGEWNKAIPLIQILTVVGYLRVIKNIAGNISLSKGNAKLGFKYNLLSLILYLPAVYFGSILGGATGIAICIVIIQLILIIPFYKIMIYDILGDFLRPYINSLIPSIKIGIILSICLLFINSLSFIESSITLFVLQLIISCAVLSYFYFNNSRLKELFLKFKI